MSSHNRIIMSQFVDIPSWVLCAHTLTNRTDGFGVQFTSEQCRFRVTGYTENRETCNVMDTFTNTHQSVVFKCRCHSTRPRGPCTLNKMSLAREVRSIFGSAEAVWLTKIVWSGLPINGFLGEMFLCYASVKLYYLVKRIARAEVGWINFEFLAVHWILKLLGFDWILKLRGAYRREASQNISPEITCDFSSCVHLNWTLLKG